MSGMRGWGKQVELREVGTEEEKDQGPNCGMVEGWEVRDENDGVKEEERNGKGGTGRCDYEGGERVGEHKEER